MIPRPMRLACLSVTALLAAGMAVAPAVCAGQGVSGRYGEMLLSVRGRHVTGAFATARGIDPNFGGPMFSCAFLLRGVLVRGHADVLSWTPGDRMVNRGKLTLLPDEARLRLESEEPGCGMAAGPMVTEDYVMRRDSPGAGWAGVGMVGARRAALRRAPGVGARRTRYLLQYDVVAILARRPGWTKIRFFGETTANGWLREGELARFAPWPRRVSAP